MAHIINIIYTNLFLYLYTYSFITYILYFEMKKSKEVNARIFGAIAFSLFAVSFVKPDNVTILVITLIILAVLLIRNLIKYIKNYDINKSSNIPVGLALVVIFVYSIVIAMKW